MRDYDEEDDEEIIAKLKEKYQYIDEKQARYYFSRRLTQELRARDISKTSFAHDLNIGKSTLTAYTTGTSLPGLETLEKIAEKLQVSTNFLLGKTPAKTITGEQIHFMLGLDEYAMENLYCLHHDCTECEGLEVVRPISNAYQNQLRILNSIIADKRNLLSLLRKIEQYIKIKEKIIAIEKNNENIRSTNEEIEKLEMELVDMKKYIEHFLYKSLDEVAMKYEEGDKS